MADTLPGKEAPKSFARRDHLRDVEIKIQERWAANKEFETDAAPTPTDGSAPQAKFMCTFPYPYMNGRLHLGHAFTVSKAEFAAGYQRLKGKRVLFPFAFHCTGMPIQAAANKLRREYETGVPEQVLAKLAAPPAAAEEAAAEASEEAEEVAPEASPAAETPPTAAAEAGKPSDGEPEKVKELGKFTGKKSKAVAKGAAGTTMSQFEIMLKSNIPVDEIPKFKDPKFWLEYFPPYGEEDLKLFGLHTDWRRSFITTDANPYYDSFIRWQFNTLRKRDKIGFGKRPTIFSPLDGQACADHDRSSGEGVGPQEYSLIKIKLQGVPASHKAAAKLAPIQDLIASGRNVYFVAATLRPETMYGQTNCYLLPEGEYGVFDVSSAANAGTGDIFICSERSAKNMSYQGLAAERGRTVCLGSYSGEELLGLPLSAPYTSYATVYTLPLLTISMKKGTGVVTSVPSDAPDDWAAYRDLKEKPKLREKYGLTEDMVSFDVIEIIEIPGWGKRAAVTACDNLKIKSQNDKEKLKEAKDAVYQAGFYQGTMLVGKYAGKKVFEAKPLVRADMFAEGHACAYWEPESIVMSRSGDECVVAELDQWYLKYGDEEWRGVLEQWVASGPQGSNQGGFNAYSAATRQAFDHTISWLKEWACSRSFGLGTKLPWDPQFVIESLSDSTIYMAYYTVAHLLHGGSLDGSTVGKLGIQPGQMNDAAWDYIFLDDVSYSAETMAVPQARLDAMRAEFRYWYPMDLRVSGKDLINNHLTMSLYNHAAVWEAKDAATGKAVPRPDRLPQSFFCNGHVLVDGDKMSKSKGNFIMLHEAVARWTADGARFALADAGDSLDDANYERDKADNAILRLTTEEEYVKEVAEKAEKGALRGMAGPSTLPGINATGYTDAASLAALEADPSLAYADKVFLSKMNECIRDAEAQYESMRFREALKYGFYELQLARDMYRDMCEKLGVAVHAGVITRFLHVQALLLTPICPHFTEHLWIGVLGHDDAGKGSVTRAAWPAIGTIDGVLLQSDQYMSAKIHEFRLAILKLSQVKPSKAAKGVVAQPKPTDLTIFVAAAWPEWQRKPLELLSSLWDPAANAGAANCGFPADALNRVKDAATADASLRPFLKKIMPLASNTIQAMKDRTTPTATLSMSLPFDEYSVWTQNAEYVRKALDLPGSLTVIKTDDARFGDAATAKEIDPAGKAKDVTPMDPDIHAYAKQA